MLRRAVGLGDQEVKASPTRPGRAGKRWNGGRAMGKGQAARDGRWEFTESKTQGSWGPL